MTSKTTGPSHGAGLARAFFAARGESPLDAANTRELEEALGSLYQLAKERHPEVQLEAVDFVRFVAPSAANAEALRALRVDELLLCCACLRGNPAALAILDQRLRKLSAHLSRYSRDIDGLLQDLRVKLVVGSPSSTPKLLAYKGKGDLAPWLRVVAVRAAIDIARKRKDVLLDEEEIWALPDSRGAHSHAIDKKTWQRHMKAAFQAALSAIAPKERLLLRQHLVDDVSLDDMARMHRVHRTTITRRLRKSRETLWADVRQRLFNELNLSPAEAEDILLDVRSQLDFSIERVLAAQECTL